VPRSLGIVLVFVDRGLLLHDRLDLFATPVAVCLSSRPDALCREPQEARSGWEGREELALAPGSTQAAEHFTIVSVVRSRIIINEKASWRIGRKRVTGNRGPLVLLRAYKEGIRVDERSPTGRMSIFFEARLTSRRREESRVPSRSAGRSPEAFPPLGQKGVRAHGEAWVVRIPVFPRG